MNLLYRRAKFLLSASTLSDLPPDEGIEVAFAGRSNAGKSSALNTITDQKSLARVSKTPGRTQLINLFEFDEGQRLVDLPGYGYAKVSEEIKRRWQHTLGQYLEQRACLRGLVLVMDVRHPLREFDLQMLEWAQHAQLPVHVLLTKADKLKRGQASQMLQQVRRFLRENEVEASVQLFSALKRTGIDEAHAVLDEWYGVKDLNPPS